MIHVVRYSALCRSAARIALALIPAALCSATGRAESLEVKGGLAVFEAEAYSGTISRGGRFWEVMTDVSGFSGSGYVVVTNSSNAASNINDLVATTSPELTYTITFPAAGTYAVWARGYGEGGTEDSVHFGLDGVPTPASSNLNWSVYGSWVWTNRTSGGTPRSVNVGVAGPHTLNLWMREDGARVDRIVITTNANFRPRIGNPWHIPANAEPGIGFMRTPIHEIYPDSIVTICNGNQYQGGSNAGNQLEAGSILYYRNSTSLVWSATAMTYQVSSGNNTYYSGVIPPGSFAAGDEVQYYLRAVYSDFLPAFLAVSNGVSFATEREAEAQANPFSYTVKTPPSSGYASPEDWRNENIYFLMTDRFYDGDSANNTNDPFSTYEPANGARLHGGDLKGIEQKLDYIKALGATAIWITPIPWNSSQRAYHGYSAYDFYGLAPQLGTTNELQAMTAAAHERGIKIVLDIVANHQGRIIDSGDAGFPAYNTGGYHLRWSNTNIQYPAPFTLADFHNYGDIANYVDPDQIIGDLRGLDDLRTETQHVRASLVDVYTHWIQTADLDGFRIDTVKHVEIGFWQYFGGEIRSFAAQMGKTNFIQFGEVFDASDAKCGYYTGTQAGGPYAMDAVVDYPLYDKINSVFAYASGNTDQIEDRYDALAANYSLSSRDRLVTFIDNHDNVRFLSGGRANNNLSRLNLALTFLYTSRGIPCLYYGTEQHFNGGNDPDNREDMFDGAFEQGPSLGDNFDMTKAGFLLVARLNNLRRNYPALTRGLHVNRWSNGVGPGLLAYARRLETQEVLVVLNTAGSTQVLPDRNTIYPPGTVMVNVFNTNESFAVTGTTNTPSISVPSSSYKIFVARAEWLPLDPVVTNQVPAHGSAGVSAFAPVVLRFSAPMNTNLTEDAIVIEPAVRGSFAWSPDRTEVTFTPAALYPLSGLTRYIVRVETNAADVENGRGFFAPYETFFDTAAIPDSDTDGVPDWWMQYYFGHATGRVDDVSLDWQDRDMDHTSNKEEYVAGTDPLDADSFFRFLDIGSTGASLNSVFGRVYDVESAASVSAPWVVVVSNVPGTGGLLQVPLDAGAPRGSYRSRVKQK